MFLRYGLIADHVVPTGAGKWTAVGTMNIVYATKWPAVHLRLGILLRIEAHPSEVGKHTLQVDFVDGLGERISGPPKIKIELGESENPGLPVGGEVGIEINKLAIPAAGNYDFVIRIDDKYIDSIPLYARDVSERK